MSNIEKLSPESMSAHGYTLGQLKREIDSILTANPDNCNAIVTLTDTVFNVSRVLDKVSCHKYMINCSGNFTNVKDVTPSNHVNVFRLRPSVYSADDKLKARFGDTKQSASINDFIHLLEASTFEQACEFIDANIIYDDLFFCFTSNTENGVFVWMTGRMVQEKLPAEMCVNDIIETCDKFKHYSVYVCRYPFEVVKTNVFISPKDRFRIATERYDTQKQEEEIKLQKEKAAKDALASKFIEKQQVKIHRTDDGTECEHIAYQSTVGFREDMMRQFHDDFYQRQKKVNHAISKLALFTALSHAFYPKCNNFSVLRYMRDMIPHMYYRGYAPPDIVDSKKNKIVAVGVNTELLSPSVQETPEKVEKVETPIMLVQEPRSNDEAPIMVVGPRSGDEAPVFLKNSFRYSHHHNIPIVDAISMSEDRNWFYYHACCGGCSNLITHHSKMCTAEGEFTVTCPGCNTRFNISVSSQTTRLTLCEFMVQHHVNK